MRVTLVQTAPKLNRSNLNDICKIVKNFQDESDLIVFSELSLNGYLLQDKLFEDAWNIDELSILAELSKKIDIESLRPIVALTRDRDTISYQENILEFLKNLKEETLHNKKTQIAKDEENLESKY